LIGSGDWQSAFWLHDDVSRSPSFFFPVYASGISELYDRCRGYYYVVDIPFRTDL